MTCSARPRCAGFTLIELLVVIAIIGVLIGLLIPAVQMIRESAHRTTCSNNLKQIGLALHQYHDTNGYFPCSSVAIPSNQSWVPYILPYIEQQPLFSQFNFFLNWNDVNQTAIATPLKIFQCPSCPMQDRVDTTYVAPQPACGDYGAVRGVANILITVGLIPPTGDLRGAMLPTVHTQLTDISDGTSSTILVGEDAGRPQLWNNGQLVPGIYVPGGGWADPSSGFRINGSSFDGTNAFVGPCALNCTNNHEFYSFHPNGAHALFADGSVHLLQNATNIAVMAALGTRSGGEVISGSTYD
jgi:prepilin-type N-terminal cleavage/methylation domain-containing protein/prepilin-type processing-associated H-X9-DG protein